MTPLLCIYHGGNCLDGFGAAWAVRHGNPNTEFFAGSYGEDPPNCIDRDVVLVDFSYKRPMLEQMVEQARTVTVLDHHKSAQENLAPLLASGAIHGIFDMQRSGAILAWEWFHSNFVPAPYLLEHIQDRDLWRFELEGSKEINAALSSYPLDFELWDTFTEPHQLPILRQEGEAILRKHMKDVHDLVDSLKDYFTIAGHTIPVANLPRIYASDVGNLMAEDAPFAACYWAHSKGYSLELRSKSDGLDVAKIAELFGGGGHARAAGFTVKSLEELD